MVHAVVELEVADIELRGGEVVMESVARRLVDAPMLCQFRVEPLERFEVMALAPPRKSPPRSTGPSGRLPTWRA
jgi:hypothetical protein